MASYSGLQGQSISGLSDKGCDSCREPCFLSVFVVFSLPANGVKAHGRQGDSLDAAAGTAAQVLGVVAGHGHQDRQVTTRPSRVGVVIVCASTSWESPRPLAVGGFSPEVTVTKRDF